jgi:hypothetical protein
MGVNQVQHNEAKAGSVFTQDFSLLQTLFDLKG